VCCGTSGLVVGSFGFGAPGHTGLAGLVGLLWVVLSWALLSLASLWRSCRGFTVLGWFGVNRPDGVSGPPLSASLVGSESPLRGGWGWQRFVQLV
jgi:hypothetical protein